MTFLSNAAVVAVALVRLASAADVEIERLTSGLPFPMTAPKLPVFADRVCSIVQFGAVGDGQTSNTAAFAKAIEACAKAGGGKVVVPPGVWLTGPIQLASNINLHVEAGALILFSRNVAEYQATGGGERKKAAAPITGTDIENVAITGQGILDGSGDAWRPVKKSKMTAGQWAALVASGGVLNKAKDIWYPVVGNMTAEAIDTMRPRLVQLTGCKRVLLDGPTFQNSPSWNIHPLLCEDLVIRNITVLNPWYSQNGDGLDIDACRRVLVYNSRFDVGDDAICLKSGAGEAARRRGRATEDVVISDCTVYHGHGGVTIGSEMSGGIRNVYVNRCVFLGTDLGLRFKSTRGRGGVVENLYFNNVYMKDIPTDAIGFTMSYGGDAPGEEGGAAAGAETAVTAVDEGTPRFRNIRFQNIVCAGAKRAVRLVGLPEMPIEGIEFANITISAQAGFEAVYARGVRVRDVKILNERGPVFHVSDSADVTIEKASGTAGADSFLTVSGNKSGKIRLLNAAVEASKKDIVLENGASGSAVVRQ